MNPSNSISVQSYIKAFRSKHGIPKQLKDFDFVPTLPNEKGKWFLSEKKMTPEQIKAAYKYNAWSEKGLKKNLHYLSWKGLNLLPYPMVYQILSNYDEFSIKTGKQDGASRYLITVDLDNTKGNADQYLKVFKENMKTTFIRTTPSGGYHLHYELPSGTPYSIVLKGKQRVNLRAHGLDIELLNGVLCKEIGPNRNNENDNEIAIYNLPDFNNDLLKTIQALKPSVQEINKPSTPIIKYGECKNPNLITWEELEFILNKTFLPEYIKPDQSGCRDENIQFAFMGLLRRYFKKEICLKAHDWLNNVAEHKKIGSTADIRHYNWNTKDKFGIPELLKRGFKDFVKAIEDINTRWKEEQEQKSLKEGKDILNQYDDFGLLEALKEHNKKLMLHNDDNILLAQLSNIGTVLGKPMSLFLIGEPSEGKSEIERISLKIIHDHHVVNGNIITLSNLFRSGLEEGNDYLNKKIIRLGDQGRLKTMERNEEVRDHIKVLATEGETHYKLFDMKTQKTINIDLVGKPSMILSSPNAPLDEQELSRGFILHASRVTGHDVLRLIQLNNSKMPKAVKRMDKINTFYDGIKDVIEHIIKDKYHVYNPFQFSVREMSQLIKHEKRQITSIETLIEIITILNQNHRVKKGNIIISDKRDIKFVYELIKSVGLLKSEIEPKYRAIREVLHSVKPVPKNKHEIAKLMDWKGHIQTLGNYLSEMKGKGYLEVVNREDSKTKLNHYRYIESKEESKPYNVIFTDEDQQAYKWHFNEEYVAEPVKEQYKIYPYPEEAEARIILTEYGAREYDKVGLRHINQHEGIILERLVLKMVNEDGCTQREASKLIKKGFDLGYLKEDQNLENSSL